MTSNTKPPFHVRAGITTPSDREIRIERVFQASPELVSGMDAGFNRQYDAMDRLFLGRGDQ